jgi:hypothetical protein
MPSVSPYPQGFLKCPTAALSVRTLCLSSSGFVNRYSLLEMLDSEPVPGDTIQNG